MKTADRTLLTLSLFLETGTQAPRAMRVYSMHACSLRLERMPVPLALAAHQVQLQQQRTRGRPNGFGDAPDPA